MPVVLQPKLTYVNGSAQPRHLFPRPVPPTGSLSWTMLPGQLAYLPLLPFLEHHPHPAYLVPEDWFGVDQSSPAGRRTSAGKVVWLNEAAKVLKLDSTGWREVRVVLGLEDELDVSQGSGSVDGQGAESSASSDSGPTVRMSSPTSEKLVQGRYSVLQQSVPATKFSMIQLVPRPAASDSPVVNPQPREQQLAPTPSLSQLISPFTTLSFDTDASNPLIQSYDPPPSPIEVAEPAQGVVLPDEPAPRPTPEEENRDRRETYQMEKMLEEFDWSQTALGDKKDWPQSLKTMVSVIMSTNSCACLWYGPDLNLIYNDAYAEMSNKKHPALFGATAKTGWAEIWDGIADLAYGVIHEDRSVHKTDDLLFMQRSDTSVPEETFFTWEWTGIKGESGKNEGMLNRAWESTTKVLAERRLKTLRELAQQTFACDSLDSFADAVIDSLKSDPHDISNAMLYLASDSSSVASNTSAKTTIKLDLVGTIGVPQGHPSAQSELLISIDASASTYGSVSGRQSISSIVTPGMPNGLFARKDSVKQEEQQIVASSTSIASTAEMTADGNRTSSSRGSMVTVRGGDGSVCPWPIELALTSGKPVFVDDCSSLTKGFESRSWGELPNTALVIPVENEDSSTARCLVLIIGLNTRRPFDEEYQSWLKLIRLSLSSGLSGVASFEAQKRRAEELERLDRAKGAFFSNVSHELRTPLTLISGPVKDLLAIAPADSHEKRLLSITDRNVQRLNRLVDMLMDVSRVEAGRMQGNFSPRHLGRFTVDLASLFRSAIEKAGLQYEVECDECEQRRVYVDDDLWEKICFNIIGNAFKYTLQGKIRVWVKYGDHDVEFGVEDTGVGIPKEDVPKVVERFHRVSTTGRSHEGTGIGLSLTAELIKVHGGKLVVTSSTKEESEDGSHGSSFVVTLPLGCAHLPPDRVEEEAVETAIGSSRAAQGFVEDAKTWEADEIQSTTATQAESASISGIVSESDMSSSNDSSSRIDPSTLFWSRNDTILIVDDNSDIRQYLHSILSPYCRILEARNGQEGYEIATQSMPNLIVSDVMMPVLDGFGLIRALKATPTEASKIPVIIITARAGEDEKVGGLLDGADDYLPKPFSSKELIARCHLQMQMGKHRIDLERKFNERTLELHIRAVEAEEKRKEAEEQRRHQELLVDVTSHELRNPVSAILQNAQLVRENLKFLSTELTAVLDKDRGLMPTASLLTMLEEDIEALEAIYMMGMSQERIANDVLSLARIQLSTLEIFPVPLDLIAETKRICSVFASECRLKRIRLSLVHGDSLQSLHDMGFKRIQADTGRLAQVLINLLSNAIRFTSPCPVREITVNIDVRKDPPDDGTCLPPQPTARSLPFSNDPNEEEIWVYGAVSDSGPGLTSDELSRLFQRFKQGSAQTHVVFGGSGLGLYVCRKLLELQDGHIEVTSDPNERGSTFRFFFKASLVPKPPLDALSPGAADNISSPLSEAGRAAKALSPSLRSVTGMRCLIVEDNLINQKVLDRQLRKAGIIAQIASDGAEAIERIKASIAEAAPFKVVLMDLEMPVLNGIGAITKIREAEERGEYGGYRHTVYALTGNARKGQIDAAFAAGMDDVILKPYKIDALLDKLRNVLQINS